MTEYKKPLPSGGMDAEPFWASCRQHAMALERCSACGHFRYPPRPLCPSCHGAESEWRPVSGRGRVYVPLTMYRGPTPAFAEEVPYNVSMIELEEGVRIWSNVVGCDPATVKIGDDVEIVYEDVTDSVTLPKFRRSAG